MISLALPIKIQPKLAIFAPRLFLCLYAYFTWLTPSEPDALASHWTNSKFGAPLEGQIGGNLR